MGVFQLYFGFDFPDMSVSGPNCGYIAESLVNTAVPLPAAVLSKSLGIICPFSLPNQLDVIQKVGTRRIFFPRHQLSLVVDKSRAL